MKQFLSLVLSLTLLLSLAACSSKPEQSNLESNPASSMETSFATGEIIDSSTDIPSSTDVANASSTESAPSSETVFSDTTSTRPSIDSTENSAASSASTTASVSSPNSFTPPVESSVPPEVYHNGSAQGLIEWVKNGGDDNPNNQAFLSAVKEKGELLVPLSIKEGLSDYGCTICENTNICVYDFRTYNSEVINENQLYGVSICPIDIPIADLRDLRGNYVSMEDVKTKSYKGMQYAYIDGYEGTGQTDRVFAEAWFMKDGYKIKITAYWSNSFLPWSEEYFDYFDFETIIL